MPDSAPDGEVQRRPSHDSGSSSSSVRSGLTDFLAAAPAGAPDSSEALQESVRALIRERDYLRQVRDIQLAEHASELSKCRGQFLEIQRLYGRERRAFREQHDASKLELAAHAERELALRRGWDECRERTLGLEREIASQRTQLADALQEFAVYRSQTAGLHAEIAAHRAQAAILLRDLNDHRAQARTLLVERDALLALRQEREDLLRDRDAWRERASQVEARLQRGLSAWLKRKLRRFVLRERIETPAQPGDRASRGPGDR